MWTTFSWLGAVQVAAGALLGAAVAIAAQRIKHTTFSMATYNAVVCTAAGVLAMAGLRWPDVSMPFVLGLIGAAAPITLALAPTQAIRTPADVVRYLRRAAQSVTVHVVYGVGFAVLGFILSLTLVVGGNLVAHSLELRLG